MLQRRSLLAGLGLVLAAPAIIRTPGLLMPVRRPLAAGGGCTFRPWMARSRFSMRKGIWCSVWPGAARLLCRAAPPPFGLPRCSAAALPSRPSPYPPPATPIRTPAATQGAIMTDEELTERVAMAICSVPRPNWGMPPIPTWMYGAA